MRGLPIQTAELRLRHFVEDDAEAIMALNAEPTTARWLPSHVYDSLSNAVEAVKYLIGCYSSPADPRLGPYVLGIESVSEGRLLGHVGFSPLNREVEVSYAVAEDVRRRGHAAAAVAMACEWVALQFAVQTVVALTSSVNEPSRRMLSRVGFVHERNETRRFQGGPEQLVSLYRWAAARGINSGV